MYVVVWTKLRWNGRSNDNLIALADGVKPRYMYMPSINLHLSILTCTSLTAGELVEREYTPVVPLLSSGQCLSQSDLLLMIKIYPYGKMTQYLATVNIGE